MTTADFKNELSWSISRRNMFEDCKRKYFYNYYGSWEGWESEAPEEARILYRLKQLDSRHTWKGTTVHDAIAFLLKCLLENKKIEFEKIEKTVVQRMRAQFRESLAKSYREDPKRKFGLLEHEYEEEIADRVWRENRDDVLECLDNFKASKYWKAVEELELSRCLALEGDLNNPSNLWKNITTDLQTLLHLPYSVTVDSFDLDGLKVWAKLDFAYRQKDGTVQIIDWKSGQSGGEPDSLQLNVYGYYASEVWELRDENIQLTIYNVAREEEFTHQFSSKAKRETRQQILANVREMKEILVEPEENKARKEDFPKIENDNFCRHCEYRLICKPGLD